MQETGEKKSIIYVRQILTKVHTLGPYCNERGRIVIWLTGCSRGCEGCVSENYQKRLPSDRITVEQLIQKLQNLCDLEESYITISGGEPFEQPRALRALCEELHKCKVKDIMIYTGFLLDELIASRNEDIIKTLKLCNVLIDGPYEKEKNDGSPMRGSSNQSIHYLHVSPAIRNTYEQYQKRRNCLEVYADAAGNIQVVGIWPGEENV